MNKRWEIVLLVFFVLLLFALNYNNLNGMAEKFLDESEEGFVWRAVDGDTVKIGNESVRLLGINTPEKGEFYYAEAKKSIEGLIVNKTVKLEFGNDKYDKYGRKLAYLILDGVNVNIEQVRKGFANIFIYDNDEYTEELKNAWNECVANGENLCEASKEKCAGCIELKELDVKNQEVIFYNNCSFDCNLQNWSIKDEGRKKFVFSNFVLMKNKEVSVIVGNESSFEDEDILLWEDEEYVWTSTGDTLFLRDDNGKLVLWREINR